MSPSTSDPSRPAVRRKSSAQNLLSSFKPSPNPITTSTMSSSYPSTPTPTVTTPLDGFLGGMMGGMVREFDMQSTAGTVSSGATLGGTSPAIGAQGTSVEYLRDLVQKRIITLTYMRNVHEGRSHWFHTVMMSRADLDRVFNNTAMKKRTCRFVILGMSLSNLLDIQQPQDLLRGLLNTMAEYDQSKEESDKPKIRLFRNRVAKRNAAGGFTEYTISSSDASDTSYLLAPHMPFPLDYHQTLLSLLDVLSEIYNKISKILGPSPFPQHGLHMMGPLGLLSPHPGVSYLFDGQTGQGGQVGQEAEGSLWGIANASLVGGPGGPVSGVGGPPANWSGLAEMVLKVDGKFKKIISTLLKELDAFARNGIKDELATLDPLLRNVAVADDGREQYDFEGTV